MKVHKQAIRDNIEKADVSNYSSSELARGRPDRASS